MAVVNRIQMTNMVRNKKFEEWLPRFRNMIYDFMGEWSTIQMPNGLGKTRMSIAFNGLLSRRRTLLRELKKTLAPASFNAYSHFRIEFVAADPKNAMLRLANLPIVGEKHVFGVYGLSDKNESLRFYHFSGILEDLPVAEENEEGLISLYSQGRFETLLSNFPGVIYKDPNENQWKRAVSEMIPLHTVERMARFQESGGGENDKSSIFQVAQQSGERFDETFFWDVLAPEMLLNPLGGSGNAEEYHFEGTILNTAVPAIRALIEGEKEMQSLALQRVATDALGPAVDAGQTVLKEQRDYAKSLQELCGAMGAVRYVVEESLLPGFPRFVPSGSEDGRVDELVKLLVIDPDQGILLRDRGLAGLLGKEVMHVNRDAEDKRIPQTVSSQYIEIVLDNSFLSDGKPGPKGKLYPLNAVCLFIDKNSDSYLPAPHEELKKVVEQAFRHFASKVDSNPFRKRANRIESDRSRAVEERGRLKGEEIELARNIRTIEEGLTRFKDNQARYEEMVNSGLFSVEELAVPAMTGEQAQLDLKLVLEEKAKHDRRLLYFAAPAALFERLRYDFGEEVSPSEKKEQWDQAEAEINDSIATARGTLTKAHDELPAYKKEEKAALEMKGLADKAYQELIAIREGAQLFLETCPGQNPIGFAGSIRDRVTKCKEKAAESKAQIRNLEPRVVALDAWRGAHPGETPAAFIEEFQSKLQLQKDRLAQVNKSIDSVNADIGFLKESKVAPEEYAQKGFHLAAAVTGATMLYEFLGSLGLDASRHELLLSLIALMEPPMSAPNGATLSGVSGLRTR
jgi:hypothetical protein